MASSIVTVLDSSGETQMLLRGDVTVAGAGELHQAARELAGAGSDVVVCCDEVTRLDASALQVLLALRQELLAADRKLTVRGMPADVAALIRHSGLAWELSASR